MIRINRTALAVLAVLGWQSAASAQSWTEPKFSPPTVSRWSVVSQSTSEENRGPGQAINQQLRTDTEFTIEEKLPDGFRISYVLRDLKITGNAPAREISEVALSGMKGIVIRGRTNAAGKPVAVDNLDEVKTSMRTVVDRMSKAFEKNPGVANFVRQMMSGLIDVDSARAAEVYMEDLPTLAAGQNTGLVPGNVKREDESVAAPIGGGVIKSTLETRVESFDAKAGTVRYIRKRSFDQESIKAVTLAMTEKLMSAASNKAIPPEVLAQMKDIKFEIESEAVITVEGGMTRKIDDRSVTTARLMGQMMRKSEQKIVTVTQMK